MKTTVVNICTYEVTEARKRGIETEVIGGE